MTASPGPDAALPSAIGIAAVPETLTGEEAVAAGMLPAAKPRSMFRRGLEVFLENKLAIVGVVILVLIFGFCYLGPLFYHTDQVT